MPFLRNRLDSTSESERGSDAFEKLVEDISSALGPSSGLDSDDVDPMNIQLLMEKYISKPSEWEQYALGDASRSYTRNLIDEGNGKSNLVSQLILQIALRDNETYWTLWFNAIFASLFLCGLPRMEAQFTTTPTHTVL